MTQMDHFLFKLPVLITEMKTQNLLGMDFRQKQVSGIHFDLPGIELKNAPQINLLQQFSSKQTLSSSVTNFNYSNS